MLFIQLQHEQSKKETEHKGAHSKIPLYEEASSSTATE